jgi:hypothetical protein
VAGSGGKEIEREREREWGKKVREIDGRRQRVRRVGEREREREREGE